MSHAACEISYFLHNKLLNFWKVEFLKENSIIKFFMSGTWLHTSEMEWRINIWTNKQRWCCWRSSWLKRFLALLSLFKPMSKSRRNQAHLEKDQKRQTHQKSWKYIQKYFEKQKKNKLIHHMLIHCFFGATNDYRLQFIVKPVYYRFI